MARVRRRRAPRERQAEPTADLRAAFARSAVLLRERVRRAMGEPPQMDDATFRAELAWKAGFAAERDRQLRERGLAGGRPDAAHE